MIHLVDKRKVEEEGIAQHHQAHPDTILSMASPRESLIVGMYVCVCVGGGGGGVSPKGSSWGRGVSFMELIRETCICIMRVCVATTRDPQTRTEIHRKPQTCQVPKSLHGTTLMPMKGSHNHLIMTVLLICPV